LKQSEEFQRKMRKAIERLDKKRRVDFQKRIEEEGIE
jgi:hypothetical protein